MKTKACRLAATVICLCLAVPGFAQTTTDNPSNTPTGRGTAPGGSRAADGAIKGGSIVPGERAGAPTDRATSRCADLSGSLREQCLAQERDSSSGGSALPQVDVAKPPTPREAPPPQNPQPRSN